MDWLKTEKLSIIESKRKVVIFPLLRKKWHCIFTLKLNNYILTHTNNATYQGSEINKVVMK